LVGKSGPNSVEFQNYSNSRPPPPPPRNFQRIFIVLIVKLVLANLEHVPASLKHSPAIDYSDSTHWKMFLLVLIVASSFVTQQVASKNETQCTNTHTITTHTHIT
jgi:hypothetical protein